MFRKYGPVAVIALFLVIAIGYSIGKRAAMNDNARDRQAATAEPAAG